MKKDKLYRYSNLKSPFLIICLAFSLMGYAKKRIYPIEKVAGFSNLIVDGKISSITPNSYQFEVAETIKGTPCKNITVIKFEEWTCDIRFGRYVIGQELLLFLVKNGPYYEIVNGSTGEIPIKFNAITLKYESFDENKFIPYKMSLRDCIDGLLFFNQCFRMNGKYNDFRNDPTFWQICDDAKITQTKRMSNFKEWLIGKMSKYKIQQR